MNCQKVTTQCLAAILAAATLSLIMAAVPASAQNAVPPTAREAAASPEFASRLAHRGARPAAPPAKHRASPQGTVIYSNGLCKNDGTGCTSDAWTINFGFVVADSFTLSSAATVKGFDFVVWAFPGDTMTSVDWSITSAPFGGITYGSGTATTTLTKDQGSNQYGYDIQNYSVSFTDLYVASGTYYLTLQNAVVSNGDPIYWDENSGPSLAEESVVGSIPSEAFDVNGSTCFDCPTPCFKSGGKLQIIHDFTDDGRHSAPSGVTIDKAGNLYGTIRTGGHNGLGLSYELSPEGQDWMFTSLYSFTETYTGQYPDPPIVGPDGALYGWADGGIQNCRSGYCGVLYNLRPSPNACRTTLCSWTENIMYRRTGDNDPIPWANLVFDEAGNLYGRDFSNPGGIYELTPSNGGWTAKVIYSFTGGKDGDGPSGLVVGNDGNLYGTTVGGGGYDVGTVFQLTPSGNNWTESVVYSFNGQGGIFPSRLLKDSLGNLFGFALYPAQQQFTVFMLSPSNGQWLFNTILVTGGHTAEDFHSLAIDDAGNLYLTARGWDIVCDPGCRLTNFFEYVSKGEQGHNGWQWNYLVFLGNQYFGASGPLALDAQGNLYGTTEGCGKNGRGTVWKISP